MRSFKKFTSWVCAVTLLVAGITVTPSKTLAADGDAVALVWTGTNDNAGTAIFTDISGETGIGYEIAGFTTDYSWQGESKWQGQVAAAGLTLDTSKYYKLIMTMSASASKNIVVQVADAPTYSFVYETTVNTDDGTVELLFQPTAANVNLTLAFGATSAAEAGTYDITLSDITLVETEETTTVAETTTAVADEDGYTPLGNGGTVYVGDWELYNAGNTWGSGNAYMSYAGTTNEDLSLKIVGSDGAAGSWELQAKKTNSSVYDGLTSGKKYKMLVSFDSTVAGEMFLKTENINNDIGSVSAVVVGTNTIERELTYTSTPGGFVVLELSGMPVDAVISNIAITFEEVVEAETTTVEGEETSEPTDTTWTEVPASNGAYFYGNVNNININNVQQPPWAAEIGIHIYAGEAPSYITLNGVTAVNKETVTIDGAGAIIHLSSLTAQVTTVAFHRADGSVIGSIDFKNPNGTSDEEESSSDEQPSDVETTTPEEQPSEPEVVVPGAPIFGYAGNDNLPYYFAWQKVTGATSYNFYIEGVKVAEGLTGSSYDAVAIAETYFATAGEYTVGLTAVNDAGESTMTTVVFTAPGFKVPAPTGLVVAGVDYGRKLSVAFAPYDGATGFKLYADGVYVADITTSGDVITIEDTALVPGTTYAFTLTAIVDGEETEPSVASNVQVPAATISEVSIDGTVVAEVEIDGTYTLPTTATYGYYSNGQVYKGGTTITVTSDIAFTSVNEFSVEAAQGAGIRYAGTAGIRFQATVNTSEDVLNSSAVATGTIITAEDIYTAHGSVLSLDVIGENYAAINVVNSGWYNGRVGTYCGSIVNIVESNYTRNFIAVAYATITYTDGTSVTVYSNMTGVRSIKGVAQAVQAAGYVGIDEAYHATIDAFAAAK